MQLITAHEFTRPCTPLPHFLRLNIQFSTAFDEVAINVLHMHNATTELKLLEDGRLHQSRQ